METVAVNGLTLCHKNSNGYTRSTLPDMCRSPTAPAPYTNTAYARDLVKGTVTVHSHGGAMNGVKGSRFAVSFGDQPGVGLGVKSGTVGAEATWLSWSPNVFMEGRPATRLTDKMLMNHGNTISAGGYKTDDYKDDVRRKFLHQLCNWACQCKNAARKQACVAEKIAKEYYDGKYPKNYDDGICREVSMKYDAIKDAYSIIMNGGRSGPPAGTVPTSNPYTPEGGIRPDALCRMPGENPLMVEMKFKGDKPNQNQIYEYPKAAEQIGADHKRLDVEEECDCPDSGGSAPAPVTLPVPAPRQPNSWLPKLYFPPIKCEPWVYTWYGIIWWCKPL